MLKKSDVKTPIEAFYPFLNNQKKKRRITVGGIKTGVVEKRYGATKI
jgi:hypothetical protein